MSYCYDNDEGILEMEERMQELQGGFSLYDLTLPVTAKIEWLQNEYDDDNERFQSFVETNNLNTGIFRTKT